MSTVSTYSRDLDYDKIDEEHKTLLQVIRDSQTEGKAEATEKLALRVQMVRSHTRDIGYEVAVPTDAVTLSYGFGASSKDAQGYLQSSISIFLSVSGSKPISNVNLLSTSIL